jgi:hypothetical protein
MWKCDRLIQTLNELSEHDLVSDIILIDNTDNTEKIVIPKVEHILEGCNTYVNPAWNKGVKMASQERLLILNDDVWFDWDVYLNIANHLTTSVGMIGLHGSTYHHLGPQNPKLNYVGRDLYRGYACSFFISRKNWIAIDTGLKIWGGDNQILQQSHELGRNNYSVSGITTNGHISLSVEGDGPGFASPDIEHIISADIKRMREMGLG